MARISICLPVYNGADYVEDALESIAAQTSGDYVVLAGNNASIDRTAEILAKWKERIPLLVFTQPETIPMQAHFNFLLDQVETEGFMLLCHDDYFNVPDALARALQTMDAQPSVSAIYCDLVYVSEKRRVLAHRQFNRSGKLNADELGRQTLLTASNMFGIPLMVRTDALGDNRYEPEFNYAMDVDLSWRVSKCSPVWHIPEALIANRYRRGNMTWSVLADAEKEFLLLAEKQGVDLSTADRLRLKVTQWFITQKKRIFGLYERVVTWFG